MQRANERLLWWSLSRLLAQSSNETATPLTALSIAIVSNSTIIQSSRYPRCAARRPGKASLLTARRTTNEQSYALAVWLPTDWLPCVAVAAVRPTEMRCESFRRRLVWAVPCSAAQRDAVQCSAVRCSAVRCDGPAGDGTNTSMIVMEIRQVTNEALLKASHPARALMATKASFVRHIAAMPPPGHTNTHTHTRAHTRTHAHKPFHVHSALAAATTAASERRTARADTFPADTRSSNGCTARIGVCSYRTVRSQSAAGWPDAARSACNRCVH